MSAVETQAAAADAGTPELTIRALATGAVLGALLAPCNVYSGLKIGWSFNMSITALLLAYLVWAPLTRRWGRHRWGMLESNINQTTASSAASIISGGLVAPLPALAMMTGENLPWTTLIAWVFAVSFLGVWVGWYLRDRLIVRARLTYPAGLATAETLQDIFAEGREAMRRVSVLLGSLTTAVGFNAVDDFIWRIPRWAPSATAGKFTFALDPSLLMLGFGAIIGLRAGIGLLLGAVLAWGLIAPELVASGTVVIADGADGFQPLVTWLLWPGVAAMVTASLCGFVGLLFAGRGSPDAAVRAAHGQSRLAGLGAAGLLVVVLQIAIFDIHWTMAIVAVPLAFLLAMVAARVAGETGIPPIGAIGKVSQLSFGVLAPAQPITNLMTANVAGGAAGQAADLLNDFKAGHLIGARAGSQVVAQCLGVLTGSIVGSLVYLQLIPNPVDQLLTVEWPAPAVATWKAVAETLSQGLSGIPSSAALAMGIGALAGLILGGLELTLPARVAAWVPSGATVGLAFVIPASTSMILFAGALAAAVLHRTASAWSRRFLMAIAAGLVAGESLFGVVSVWFA